MRNKKDGAFILVLGASGYIIFTLAYIIYVLKPHESRALEHLFGNINILCIPISITLLLAREFAQLNRSLERKLIENEKLSSKTIVQEQEKKQILSNQKVMLEKQVIERTRELNKSLEELKAAQSQLIQSEKMASLGELTAGIAHEIQNPLNFVNNFSEVNKELIDELQNELNTGDKEEAITISNDIKENEEKINHHGKRADAIVKGMLQHSRATSGEKEPTDINGLCDEYLRLAYHGLKAKDKNFNATMQTDFDSSLEKIKMIPQDIGRVLLNLFNNAFYAVQQKQKDLSKEATPFEKVSPLYEPMVSVQTKIDDSVEIKVSDNGNGIPQNIVDKVFQPFFTTKPTGQGTGLGLSLSYDIIKAHGGELKIVSNEGDGATFIITLQA
ncbi:MAG: ATP-binding protein [Ginsengibacter sp.]